MADGASELESLRKLVNALLIENDRLKDEARAQDERIAELEEHLEEASYQVCMADDDLLEHSQKNGELERRIKALTATISALAEREDHAGSDEEKRYLASAIRRHFHRPSCEWVANIPKEQLRQFHSRAEVLSVIPRLRPCKTCRA
jgi:chromosome segregation ATPase